MNQIMDDGKQRIACYIEWRKSEEYQAFCANNHKIVRQLMVLGEDFLRRICCDRYEIRSKADAFEYASGGNIHRGYYCPSPVFDLLVVYKNRGRIVTGAASVRKARRCFAFDSDRRLVYVDHLQGGKIINTEYLLWQDHICYGFTVNSSNELESVSEEVYENGKLVRYSLATVYPDEESYFCSDLRT